MCLTGHIGRAHCLEGARRHGTAKKIRDKIDQIFCHGDNPIQEMPTATAGLKAPPEMLPTENAPTNTVKPIASP